MAILVFVTFVAMPFFPFVSRALEVVHWPLITLMESMQRRFFFLTGSDRDIYYGLAALLCYWILIGLLVGLGCWILKSRRHKEHAEIAV